MRAAPRLVWHDVLRAGMILAEPTRRGARRRALARALADASPRPRPAHPVVLLMVYRRANAALVELMARQAGPGADVRLWALDSPAPSLAPRTLGRGPGRRFENLNRLLAARGVAPGSWIVVADDDTFFVRGGLARLMERMETAGFAIGQPAHDLRSWWNSPFTIARPGLVARETAYVEQGPVTVLTPEAQALVLPLPESNDMGWGVEAQWSSLRARGLRLGIVDESRVVHAQRPASAYDPSVERARMRERVAAAGLGSIWEIQRTLARWRASQASPPSGDTPGGGPGGGRAL